MNLLLVFIIFMWVVFNFYVIISADYKEWFEDLMGYNICEFILLFTLFLPTTIVMALIYILSIKPFDRKEK